MYKYKKMEEYYIEEKFKDIKKEFRELVENGSDINKYLFEFIRNISEDYEKKLYEKYCVCLKIDGEYGSDIIIKGWEKDGEPITVKLFLNYDWYTYGGENKERKYYDKFISECNYYKGDDNKKENCIGLKEIIYSNRTEYFINGEYQCIQEEYDDRESKEVEEFHEKINNMLIKDPIYPEFYDFIYTYKREESEIKFIKKKYMKFNEELFRI